MSDERSGVVVVILSTVGVAATAADFDSSSPAGYTVEESQTMRAKDRAWRIVMSDFCQPDIADAVCGSWTALSTVTTHLLNNGWKELSESVEVQP